MFKFIISLFKTILYEISDLIYKRRCVGCRCSIQSHVLCNSCLKTVQNLSGFAQAKMNGYDTYCAYPYDGVIKKMVHELKFKHNKACAYYIASLLIEYIKNSNLSDLDPSNITIMPVPTHIKNYYERGYDNVYEIAKNLALMLHCELDSTSLKKIKYTKPMFKLTAKQRADNVFGSFELNLKTKPKGTIILLDDIFTTGATLDFITSLFKKEGVDNLICLTFSKTKF